MKELVIDIRTDGVVESLHSDAFDIGFLGTKSVHRQCDIAFRTDSQTWDVEYLGSGTERKATPLRGFHSYRQAQLCEVAWLNDCRVVGVDPLSQDGVTLAEMVHEFKGP